jgi:hypothetical protein
MEGVQGMSVSHKRACSLISKLIVKKVIYKSFGEQIAPNTKHSNKVFLNKLEV